MRCQKVHYCRHATKYAKFFVVFIIVIVLVSSYTTIRWNLEAVSCSDTKTSEYIEEVEVEPKGKASVK